VFGVQSAPWQMLCGVGHSFHTGLPYRQFPAAVPYIWYGHRVAVLSHGGEHPASSALKASAKINAGAADLYGEDFTLRPPGRISRRTSDYSSPLRSVWSLPSNRISTPLPSTRVAMATGLRHIACRLTSVSFA